MNIRSYYHYFRNKAKLMKTASDIVDAYGSRFSSIVSSRNKKTLLQDLSESLGLYRSDVASWRDFNTDYVQIAHTMLVRLIDNTLENFRAPLHLRVFDDEEYFRFILSKCLDWGIEHHILTPEDRKAYRC